MSLRTPTRLLQLRTPTRTLRNLVRLHTPTPLSHHPLLLYTSSSSPSFHANNSLEDKRKANLGSMVEYLRTIIPESLHVVPDTDRLDKEILLRVSPTIHTNVPMIKGTVSYITTLKATQLIFTSFVLGADVKLHITDLKVDEKGETKYGMYAGATKIIVKWTTCAEGCPHLLPSRPIRDSEKAEKHLIEWGKILRALKLVEERHEEVHRVMSGIFVFELNKENDRILVHNVENVEMIDKKDLLDNMGRNLATG